MVLVVIICLIVFILLFSSNFSRNKNPTKDYYATYTKNEEELLEEYSDYEISTSKGDRDYFTDDPSRDYVSYYSQIADDAMMGDEEAIDEIESEFGEEEW